MSSVRTLTMVVQRLRDHGSFKIIAVCDRGRQHPDRVANVEEAILEDLQTGPCVQYLTNDYTVPIRSRI